MSHASTSPTGSPSPSSRSEKTTKAVSHNGDERRVKSAALSKILPSVASKVISSPNEDSEAAEKRRKAAAEARKRRRHINSSRRSRKALRVEPRSNVSDGPSSTDDSFGMVASQPGMDTEKRIDDDVANSGYAYVLGSPRTAVTRPIKRLESTIEGMAEVTQRWDNNEIVAVPTECTYEACISLRTFSNMTPGSLSSHQTAVSPEDWAYRLRGVRQVATNTTANFPDSIHPNDHHAPYCWVPRTADCCFLRDCFPARLYGTRAANGRAGIAHRFNETHEVIQRIARHLWPGPVTFHVAVPSVEEKKGKNVIPGNYQRSFWSNLTFVHHDKKDDLSSHESTCSPYLTLRSPRHPLAIKVAKEHMGDSYDKSGSMNRATTTSVTGQSFAVLIGFPILKAASELSDKPNQYCRSSQDVQNKQASLTTGCSSSHAVSAVLDGENHPELFAVPPCEYGEPSQCGVWIHGPSRTITLRVKRRHKTTGIIGSESSTLNGFHQGNFLDSSTLMSKDRIKTALRQRIPRRPALPKEKDMIIQTILCRWNVVAENDQEVNDE